MAKASRGDDQYMLRFPEGLRDRIKSAAEANARSMNSEIIERIEGYELIQWKMSHLVEEKEKLSAQLDATRDALAEQRKISDQLQHLLNEGFEKAKQDQETESVITTRFNELKVQSDYLEALKAELLELSKDRHDTDSKEDHLIIRLPADLAEKISQAGDLMKRTMEDQAIDTLEKSYLPPRYLR